MKFAIVNGVRAEAQPTLSSKCPICDHPMVAKCGKIKIWHWAHQGKRICDSWWENETEWHRAWKNQFPKDWQEIIHKAENGEKHIADVITNHNWVIELQHSYIKPEERQSRNAFYQKLIWVVDGTRRKKDERQFSNAWSSGKHLQENSPIRIVSPHECTLLKEWSNSHVPIFFDFGKENLWWCLAQSFNGLTYVMPFSRTFFIKIHQNLDHDYFKNLVDEIGALVPNYELHRQRQVPSLAFQSLHFRSRTKNRL